MGAPRVRTRVKVCGITRVHDARVAAEAGADAIGLVFYPQSPRYLSGERAVEIRDALPPFVQTVALFVNPDAAQVAQVLQRVRPALLQFHGDETPEFCAQFGVPFVKACRVKTQAAQADLLEYLRPFSRAAAWLFDSYVAEYGDHDDGQRYGCGYAQANASRTGIQFAGPGPRQFARFVFTQHRRILTPV